MCASATALILILSPAVLSAREDDALARRIRTEADKPALKKSKVGILVVSKRTGKTIFSRNEDVPLRLASNTKLLTTAAALCLLGADYTFETVLGTHDGDLHVFGAGDPNISGRFHDGDPVAVFKGWAKALKAAGVDNVGDLVLHTGIFDGEQTPSGWKGYDRWEWWAAPFGPLSLNDNCVDVTVAPGKVSLSPKTEYVTVENRAKSRPGKPQKVAFSRPKGKNVVTIRGEIGGKSTHSIAIHDPAPYFGAVLRETLRLAGVKVSGKARESDVRLRDAKDFKEIAIHVSDLPRTLTVCNSRSQNFYAEMLLRVLGWRARGRGTTANGLAVVAEFLSDDVGAKHVSQVDGSGLSRDNFASPSDLVKLLRHLRSHEHRAIFFDSLAVNGAKEGTLRRRMRAKDVAGKIHAKTGHIRGVSALSGYADSAGGDTFFFSILVNGAGGDALQNAICELLVRHKGE